MRPHEWASRLLDRSLPAVERAQAAEAHALASPGYNGAGPLCRVIFSEDEDAVVRCAAVRALSICRGTGAINQLVRAFHNREVRRAAVETLESIGAVDGWLEERLLADLATVRRSRNEEEITLRLANLPGSYGRDPRVIECLIGELGAQEAFRRAGAADSLCVLVLCPGNS